MADTKKYTTAHLYKLAARHGLKVDDSHPTCWYVDSPAFHAFEVNEDGTPGLTCLCADWSDGFSGQPHPLWSKGSEIDALVRELMQYIEAGFEEITTFDPGYSDPENWPKPEQPSVFA